MKTKIVFFGAMAAIMMSAGANAAVTQIASKEYVDTAVADRAAATIVDALSGRVTTVEGNITTINGQISGLSADVSDLKTTVGDTDVVVNRPEDQGGVITTVTEAVNYLDGQISGTLSGLGALASKDTVATGDIDNGAVTEVKLEQNLQNKINSALTSADLSNYATKTEVTTEITNYAIEKPSAACMAQSGTCVLTISTDGTTLKWVSVTGDAPAVPDVQE